MNPELTLRTELRVEKPIHEVFAFFAAAENLERITPPELGFRIATPAPLHMESGSLIDYRLSLFGVPFAWRTRITEWNPPHSFTDVQLKGPYAQWIHRHTFSADGDGTIMRDAVYYRLPVPLLGMLAWPLVRLQLARIFSYREQRIRSLLDAEVIQPQL